MSCHHPGKKIPWKIALKHRPKIYGIGTSVLNRFLASMAIDHPEFSNVYSIKKTLPKSKKKPRKSEEQSHDINPLFCIWRIVDSLLNVPQIQNKINQSPWILERVSLSDRCDPLRILQLCECLNDKMLTWYWQSWKILVNGKDYPIYYGT
jgi:hypothetical protein